MNRIGKHRVNLFRKFQKEQQLLMKIERQKKIYRKAFISDLKEKLRAESKKNKEYIEQLSNITKERDKKKNYLKRLMNYLYAS